MAAIFPGPRGGARTKQPFDAEAGDRVLIGKWSGTEVKHDSVEYLNVQESDILGIIERRNSENWAA